MGSIELVILVVNGLSVVVFGSQVIVVVNYLVMIDQDIVVWFQLDVVLFIVYVQMVMGVSGGFGIIDVVIDIFIDVFLVIGQYCYLVFIVLQGGGVDDSFFDLICN